MRIKEVIVVEGHHDTNVLQQYFDCETIETNGLALSAETLDLIKEAQQRCGVIIFTDPDYPGEKIRRMINDAVDGCKNAYIEKNKAKTPKKVGVEHARREDLLEALEHCFTYTEQNEVTFTMDDIMELGLQGKADSAVRREWLGRMYHLGKPNAKTLLKRLNLLQVHPDEVRELLKKGGFA